MKKKKSNDIGITILIAIGLLSLIALRNPILLVLIIIVIAARM
jgi:hypothetical protein